MVSSDTVVGIVGAVILTGAMIAVFYYESGRDPGAGGADLGHGNEQFMYTFENNTATETGTGTLSAGGSDPHDIDLPAYARNVHVQLTWSVEPVGGLPLPPLDLLEAPTFKIEILDGNGTVVATETASATRIDGSADVRNQSGEFAQYRIIVAGDSAADADETVRMHMEGFPVRTWTVRVTLEDDGDPTGAVGPSYTYEAQIHITHLTPLRPAS